MDDVLGGSGRGNGSVNCIQSPMQSENCGMNTLISTPQTLSCFAIVPTRIVTFPLRENPSSRLIHTSHSTGGKRGLDRGISSRRIRSQLGLQESVRYESHKPGYHDEKEE